MIVKVELPYNLEIPLLGTYLEKKKPHTLISDMSIAALFTITKICKQLKCSSTDELIKKMWYIYTMGYYSATKRTK